MLFNMFLQHDQLKPALELLQVMDESKLAPDAMCFTAVLTLCSKHQDITNGDSVMAKIEEELLVRRSSSFSNGDPTSTTAVISKHLAATIIGYLGQQQGRLNSIKTWMQRFNQAPHVRVSQFFLIIIHISHS